MGRNAVYLMFNGNCEEAINYYAEHLGGNITQMQRYGDTPQSTSASYKDKIMHGIMDLQGLTVMFSDVMEARDVRFGDNFSLAMDFKTEGDLVRAFDALSTGGTVTMAIQETFWNAVFAMCTDKFGINWMFNFDKSSN